MEKVKGWVTEKIFDVLVARSVTIYWGAENIEEFVDTDTFIDRRKFKNDKELADYLFSVTEERYNEYLAAGERYLQSEKFKKFLPENFSKTIMETLGIK
ncbi:MAG: glycosyltransferase family 10 [Candidatus Parcubacteria bacterium]|nr:glycosyltransferase family 10 [Candidatus Parcubacteria bacterium]